MAPQKAMHNTCSDMKKNITSKTSKWRRFDTTTGHIIRIPHQGSITSLINSHHLHYAHSSHQFFPHHSHHNLPHRSHYPETRHDHPDHSHQIIHIVFMIHVIHITASQSIHIVYSSPHQLHFTYTIHVLHHTSLTS